MEPDYHHLLMVFLGQDHKLVQSDYPHLRLVFVRQPSVFVAPAYLHLQYLMVLVLVSVPPRRCWHSVELYTWWRRHGCAAAASAGACWHWRQGPQKPRA